MPEVWKPDPTGRCELRLQIDDRWTDHVSQRGVALIDPWEDAQGDPRPRPPWEREALRCVACDRGVCRSEPRCPICGWAPTTTAAIDTLTAARRKTTRVVVAVTVVVLLVAGAIAAYQEATREDPCVELLASRRYLHLLLHHDPADTANRVAAENARLAVLNPGCDVTGS